MLYVSVPHDKLLNLNQRYWVYDTDDGVAEQVYATDILKFLSLNQTGIKGVTPHHYGGMRGTLEKLPDGTYMVRDQGYFTVKDGVTLKGCDFLINTEQGVRKGKVVNLN